MVAVLVTALATWAVMLVMEVVNLGSFLVEGTIAVIGGATRRSPGALVPGPPAARRPLAPTSPASGRAPPPGPRVHRRPVRRPHGAQRPPRGISGPVRRRARPEGVGSLAAERAGGDPGTPGAGGARPPRRARRVGAPAPGRGDRRLGSSQADHRRGPRGRAARQRREPPRAGRAALHRVEVRRPRGRGVHHPGLAGARRDQLPGHRPGDRHRPGVRGVRRRGCRGADPPPARARRARACLPGRDRGLRAGVLVRAGQDPRAPASDRSRAALRRRDGDLGLRGHLAHRGAHLDRRELGQPAPVGAHHRWDPRPRPRAAPRSPASAGRRWRRSGSSAARPRSR